ncbi:MAG: hypothetical protein IJD80_07000, partial [Oscillospiraceae bacterium]|nr:hypothetical protein [Oscillospiraceae bacterium]
MKKVTGLLLAMMILFTGCTGQQSQSQPVQSKPPLIIESDTGLPVTPLDKRIAEIKISDILNPDKIRQLDDSGISASVISAERKENDTVDLKVRFTSKGSYLDIDVAGEVSYCGTENDFYNLGVYALNANVWGPNMVLVFPDRIVYYDTYYLSQVVEFTYPEFEGRFIDAVPHGYGTLALYHNGSEWGFAKFTASGEFLWKNTLPPDVYLMSAIDSDGGYNREVVVHPRPNITYMDRQDSRDVRITKDVLVYTSGVGVEKMSDHSQEVYPDFIYEISSNTMA